jgi:hypothetical protein
MTIKYKGWTTGYRSKQYYASGSTYIKLSFPSLVQITKISLKQLGSAYVQFSKFMISFSDDDSEYVVINEVSF